MGDNGKCVLLLLTIASAPGTSHFIHLPFSDSKGSTIDITGTTVNSARRDNLKGPSSALWVKISCYSLHCTYDGAVTANENCASLVTTKHDTIYICV